MSVCLCGLKLRWVGTSKLRDGICKFQERKVYFVKRANTHIGTLKDTEIFQKKWWRKSWRTRLVRQPSLSRELRLSRNSKSAWKISESSAFWKVFTLVSHLRSCSAPIKLITTARMWISWCTKKCWISSDSWRLIWRESKDSRRKETQQNWSLWREINQFIHWITLSRRDIQLSPMLSEISMTLCVSWTYSLVSLLTRGSECLEIQSRSALSSWESLICSWLKINPWERCSFPSRESTIKLKLKDRRSTGLHLFNSLLNYLLK